MTGFGGLFFCHGQVRLGFKLAAGLFEPWCRDSGIPQGCPLSMVFIVALYVPWCRHLEALPDVKPQLYADNLKCSAERPGALFEFARFTAQYVRSVGQDVSPGKCVLLSTSKSVRKAMKLRDISGDGGFWNVQLDVRDLWDFKLRWSWFVVSTFLLVFMLLKHLMSPPRLSVLLELLLCGQCGPPKCLLPMPLPSIISLMGLLQLILLSMLSGPGFA